MKSKIWTTVVLCLCLTLAPLAEEVSEKPLGARAVDPLGSEQLDQSMTLTFTAPVVLIGEVREAQSGRTTVLISDDGEQSAFLWDTSWLTQARSDGPGLRVELQPNVPYFILHAEGDHVWLGGYRGIFVLPKSQIQGMGATAVRGGPYE